MKILRISSWPSLQRQGVGLSAYHLSRLGCDGSLTICARQKGAISLEHPSNRERLIEIPFHNPTMPNNRISFAFALAILERSIKLFIFYVQTLLSIGCKSFDLVHLHSPMYLPLGIYFKLRGAKLALSLHGSDFFIIKRSKFWLFLAKKCQYIFCVSEEQRVYFANKFPDSVAFTVKNGVNLNYFSPSKGNPLKKHKLVTVGSLRWQKGFMFLIKALSIVIKEKPSVQLDIYGEGPDRQELQNYINSNNLSENIRLCGHQSPELIREAMQTSNIFVSSSVSEGLPKVILEAIACGCPVITTDVGESKATIGEAGLVVSPGDPASLASAILKLLQNHKLRQHLSKRGVSRAQEFSWEIYVEKVACMYSGLQIGTQSQPPNNHSDFK